MARRETQATGMAVQIVARILKAMCLKILAEDDINAWCHDKEKINLCDRRTKLLQAFQAVVDPIEFLG